MSLGYVYNQKFMNDSRYSGGNNSTEDSVPDIGAGVNGEKLGTG